MRMGCRRITAFAVLLGSFTFAQWALGKNEKKQSSATTQMSEQKRALHALNRLAFGPKPGDVERVMAMGVDRWIEQQLHPEKLDDTALEARLASFPSLRMSTRELVENFPPPAVIKAIADGKQSLPSDPVKHAVYLAQLERYEEKQERKQEAAQGGEADPKVDSAKMGMSGSEEDGRSAGDTLEALLDMPPDQRFRAVLAMPSEHRRDLAASLRSKADQFLQGMSPQQCETIKALNNPQQVVADELVESKLLRAVYSERQLQEVMTDFWFNHFNVFMGKGADRYELTSYERDVIRPHAFGKFENLLVAVAQSPAMLFYLDNGMSVGPNSDFANGIQKKKNDWQRNKATHQSKKRGGLNENYGRELMELHTLGVNGGYTQEDVTEVARVFTGWTLREPRQGGGFTFDERKHEPGNKIILGHRIKSKGEKEGLQVLHILAHHPSTAKFICTKLAIRFVSDDPPPALVERMSHTFSKKDGDIREVLETLFSSPEFWAEDEYRAKVKTPLEFVISSVRASGAEITDAMPLARQLQNMGMPLYGAQPPTGYSMKADAWVNSSALLGRMNFALALAAGKLKGTQVDADRLFGAEIPADPQQTLALLESSLLGDDVSKQTHEVISARLQDPKISRRKLDDPARPPNVAIIEGLLLGSPEFQRR
jgi:uncharacterized protein (DUF1800 family)